jgi:diaminohydroxyphosphoribosylaminopyrimidine deaminase / 5-amino-6-(5-phosphoribosylamino)uracil reductase
MRTALALARRGLGRVAPNPAVGCVLVKGDHVVGRGWTAPGGRPHAETEALARAGAAATGATAYVTLEPCAHHGATPPCADALIAAGVKRAVVAMLDPDPRVDGGGMARLRAAGIAVAIGVLDDEAAALNAGFLLCLRQGRPLVTLKLATTLDGRIATTAGDSRWITGAQARDLAHELRASHDAVMVGAGTARIDDPALDCRLPGMADRAPIRVVMGGRTPLPAGHRFVARAGDGNSWLIVAVGADVTPPGDPAGAVKTIAVAADSDGRPDIAAALRALAARGVTRLLVEGGGTLAAALLRHHLVDRVVWFRAPRLIGGDGVAAVAGFGVAGLDGTANFVKLCTRPAGADMMEIYARQT